MATPVQPRRLPLPCQSGRATFFRTGEQNANAGPRFYGSVAALCRDDVLTFACLACRHQASMEARTLKPRVASDLLIEDLDPRLRCTSCGARGQAQLIAVEAAER